MIPLPHASAPGTPPRGPAAERTGAPSATPGPEPAPPPALELLGIARRFGRTVALHDAYLTVPRGTLQALLGENGAGKSTLVHVAFGELRPDAGRVLVDGREREFTSPAHAMAAGLGMVHQHFRLVPAMTVAENVALGRTGHRLRLGEVASEIRRLGEETGLRVDPEALVGSLGVAAQQRVEVVKALARGARTLILDEPTAVLAPAEADEMLGWIRRYVDAGGAAVLITHKLREALAVADGVTVLRRGGTVLTGGIGAVDEEKLVAAMIGGEGTAAGRRHDGGGSVAGPERPVIVLEGVAYREPGGAERLAPVTVTVHAGEIVGVAGVEGSGQHELIRVLAGRLAPTSGRVSLPDRIGFVPEDRHQDALVLGHSLVENVVLRGAGRRRGRIRWRAEAERTRALIDRYDVRGGTPHTPVRALSGGNQQKLVFARELDGDPEALVVESPTRGLDVRASAAVLDRLREARGRGVAVVAYSSDLDELLSVADRVLVMYAGRVREVQPTRAAIGRAMVGAAD